MAQVTLGTAINFGVDSATEAGNTAVVASAYSCTTKQDTKEMRHTNGNVKSVALHRKVDDISVDFIVPPSNAIHAGSVLHSDYSASTANEIYIDEVTVDLSNEDFRKTSVKATGYYTTP